MDINSYNSAKQAALKRYFSRMNDMQQEAVFTVNGPVLVLAGAGSGKTTVIVNRIANMINFGNAYFDTSRQGNDDDTAFLKEYAEGRTDDFDTLRDIVAVDPIRPWNILAITFTNKAAGELKERLSAMLGEEALNIHASTFHSACVRILRSEIEALGYGRDFTIYDSDDSQRMIKNVMGELDVSEKQLAPKAVLSEISFAKDKMITPAELRADAGQDYRKKMISKLYALYQERMRAANAVDFDDILVLTVELFEKFPEVLEKYRNRFKYIMVDEYQDTNHVQFRLVSLLSGGHKNLCVVGDDDQSIYKFRGANIENILGFEEQFEGAKVIRLEQNYRSTQTILNAANSVISNNNGRKPKTLWTAGEQGDKVYWYKAVDETDEAKFVADTILASYKETGRYSDNAVLYRMNAQSNSIERMLVKCGIPYRVYGGMRFYDRKEIKDVTSYLSFINNHNDMLRFRRIINEPKRGIGDSTLTVIEDISRDLKISPFEVLKNCEEYAPLSKKVTALRSAYQMFEFLTEKSEELPLDEFLDVLLDKTGYLDSLKALENAETKIENVQELRTSMAQYMEQAEEPTLGGFLEEVALYTEADRDDGSGDKVTLMTIHSAKGLEYENIFVVGMDDGIFPSSRSFDSEDDMEEERRLAYVAITRAKKRLYLTNASQRMIFGQTQRNVTSRFMREIGSELIEKHDNAAAMKKHLEENDKSVTEVRSATLQQQLARSKKASSAPKEAVTYTAGEKVSHSIFGEGVIVSVTPMSNDSMLEIAFDKVGTKKIMANYAKLKKL
ncbi:ATP-dependent helicase [Ruminococcus flavefaciens]|uniref:DNA 3'-5' helicase n=1 Tax=Ruminococcus flavefaciens TaxID=1265 RepID=A0A315XYR1_RUMFL|nr:UvrD-helicase domain-containing protein [Ruminococcus flavefaciens]PWJ12750.1 DNA helicase-2/ATP-dependent DNA helicase PcrA [Ruminococcus flavefaciens]SSA49401.1 DNA helicase-2 / ATP-dependent DNA helicase PcrA [Ruminococcus flavefaciens]